MATTARCHSGTAALEPRSARCASRSARCASAAAAMRRRPCIGAFPAASRRHHSLSARPKRCDAPAQKMASARAMMANPRSI
eukprot:scaffold38528_cov21-Tisochrysis_lutea.AAC.5